MAPDLVDFLEKHRSQANRLLVVLQKLVRDSVEEEDMYTGPLIDATEMFDAWEKEEFYLNACVRRQRNSWKQFCKKQKPEAPCHAGYTE